MSERRVEPTQTGAESWRYRCPEGHVSIERYKESFRCRSCGLTYSGDPIDASADASAIDTAEPEPYDKMTPRIAVQLLWDYAGDTDTTAHARELSAAPSQVGAQLRVAAEKGLVERVGVSRAEQWRVTESGARLAGPNDWGRDR